MISRRSTTSTADPNQRKAQVSPIEFPMETGTVFGLVGLARWRGGWLANVAAGLGMLGLTTMPGFLIVDLLDSTMGREIGVEATVRIATRSRRCGRLR